MNDCTIHFDGGVRGNVSVHHPLFAASRGAWGWVAQGKGGMKIMQDAGLISPATSMMAELHGCLHALEWASRNGYEYVTLKGDSILVIKWLLGEYRTSQIPHLASLQRQIASLISCEVVVRPSNRRAIQLTKEPGQLIVAAKHIPRSKNRYADALCGKALKAVSHLGVLA